MNTINCYIGISKIKNAGLGLFSGEFIKKGTIVWKNHTSSEIAYSEKEFFELPEKFRKNIEKYVYKCDGEYRLNLDDSRHYNHSDEPNTLEDVHGNFIAARDIEHGEELTCNYRLFYDNDWAEKILRKWTRSEIV